MRAGGGQVVGVYVDEIPSDLLARKRDWVCFEDKQPLTRCPNDGTITADSRPNDHPRIAGRDLPE